jgi:PAS domain S-box-containing protein
MNTEPIRVLLIEDNPGDARLMKENLALAGTPAFHLDWAPDLAAGLKYLEEKTADAILLDPGLPDSRGFTTFEKMHARAPQMPIILLTGLEDDTLAARAMQSGAQDYLVKSDVTGRLLGRMILYAIERKRTEEALRKSEAQLSNAVAIAQLGPWEYDVETDLFTFNDQFYAVFGTTAAAVGGYTMKPAEYAKRFIHPEDQWIVGAEMKKALETDDPGFNRRLEHRVVRADGTVGYISVRYFIVKDAKGKTVKTYGVNQDITERKRAEEALQALSSRQKALLSAIPDIIMEVNTDKVYTWANRAGLEFFGEDVIGREAADYFAGEQKTYDMVQPVFSGNEEVIYVESWQWRKDGEKRLLAWWCRVLKDERGNVIGALSSARDITELHRVEEALRKSEAQLSNAASIARLGPWEYDVEKDLFTFNDQFYAIFKTTAAAAGGYTMTSERYAKQFLHPDDQMIVGAETRKAIETDDPHFHRQLEHRVIFADGTIGYISVRFFIVKDADGKTIKTYGVNQDITDRKRAEEALRESEKRYRELFENINSGVAVYDVIGDGKNFIFKEFNRAGERIDHDKRERLIGKSILEVRPGAEKMGLLDVFRKVWRTGQPVFLPRILYQDERLTGWYENYVYKLPSGEIVAVFENVTERKQAEETLQESERRLREAQALGRVGSWEFDLGTQKITWSDETFRLYERDPELGPPRVEEEAGYYSPEQAEKLREYMRRSISEKKDFEYDLEAELPGRKKIFFAARMHPIPDANGRVVRLFGTVQDITSRKQRELELEAVSAVSAALRGASTRAEMIPVILDQMLSLLEADGVMMTLPLPNSRELMVELGRGSWASASGGKVPLSSGTVAEALSSGRPYLKNDVRKHTRPLKTGMLGESRSIACIPFIVREQTIGLLWIGSRRNLTRHDMRLLAAVADIAASALWRVTLLDQTEERLQKLDSLRTVDRAITGSVNLGIILNVVTRQAIDHLNADAAAVLLLHPQTSILTFAAGSGFRTKEIERTRLRLGEGQAGKSALERKTVSIPDLAADSGTFRRSMIEGEGFVSHHATPLVSKGQVKGILEVFRRAPLSVDADWFGFFETLAEQAAIAIDNAQLFEGLQRSHSDLTMAYDATIEGWSRALDLRDKETEGHTERVTEMTLKLARSMGIREGEMVHIRRGALLHDIGKMAIPDSILLKSGPLDEREWEIMRRHPAQAYELLFPIAYLRPALDIPYCHHEHWDGSGYPRGLKGDLIPLAARLFAVVDVWDALLSERPYRAPWPAEKVLEHIRSHAGTHFEPEVVKAFLALLEK